MGVGVGIMGVGVGIMGVGVGMIGVGVGVGEGMGVGTIKQTLAVSLTLPVVDKELAVAVFTRQVLLLKLALLLAK
jgi:hypothetical protein